MDKDVDRDARRGGEDPARVSVVMIVKNAAEHLRRTVDSLSGAGFDEVVIVDTGSTDGTQDIAKQVSTVYGEYKEPEPVTVDGVEYISDFSKARNYANTLATGEYIFWIDADDVLLNSDGLRDYIDRYIRTRMADCLAMLYDYDHDKQGHCTNSHPRERVVRKEDFVWRSPIHEVLCALRQTSNLMVPGEVSRVVHEIKGEERESKLRRNCEISKRFIERNGQNVEPRQWLSYGRALSSLKDYKQAIECFQKYLDGSGWNHERYYAFICQSECFARLNLHEQAIRRLLDAVRLYPNLKEAYIELGWSHLHLMEPDNAIHWSDMALRAPDENCGYQVNPLRNAIGAHEVKMHAYMEKLKFREAIEQADKILKLCPDYREALIKKSICSQMLRENELADAFKKLQFMLNLEGSEEKLVSLSEAVPRSLEGRPDIIIKPEIGKPFAEKTIYFYCGENGQFWGDDSIEKGGIGGSETAVIYMARELAKLGWRVSVFGYPKESQEGMRNGVLWLPYWRLGTAASPDILVAWRSSSFVHLKNARAKYIWLHDVQFEHLWAKESIHEATAVIPLSKAHRENVSFIPDEKIFLSRNGLDPSFFGELKNEPHRLIYASSPNRGLQLLLPRWGEIKRRFPDATLDVFYGFTDLYKLHMQSSEYLRKIYELVMREINQDGIHYHGFVDQGTLSRYFHRAGIWAYPCPFGEISCITAMQAQAAGAVPVTTGFWALSETTQHGRVIGGPKDSIEESKELEDRFFESLLDAMLDPSWQAQARLEMVPWARTTYLWREVAQEWNHRFRTDLGLRTTSANPQLVAS